VKKVGNQDLTPERIAWVTGGSRGVGRGIAEELAAQAWRVYVTGRRVEEAGLPAGCVPLRCDHADDRQVDAAFDRLARETSRLDLLVNNVWGGYERMVEDGRFTWGLPFWEQPRWRWDAMFASGVRAHYVASGLAARRMVEQRQGLIVNVSFWAARKHIANVAYGVSKAATDKLTADMAHELRAHDVPVISLYPGLVRTEKVLEAAAYLDLSNSESPRFLGRVVAAMAGDPDLLARSGTVIVAAAYAREKGIEDVDGRRPDPLALEQV
jgi:dehydrogenase/reductase SDR family protein 1